MNILVLSQFSEAIAYALPASNATVRFVSQFSGYDPIEDHKSQPFDLLVSFGYNRHLPVDHPQMAGIRAINLHTSLLPYGRGLNPNLTAWLNGEPHGLSIHEISSEYDRGDIIFQQRLVDCFDMDAETLRSTYERKIALAITFLADAWPDLVENRYRVRPQPQGYSSLMTARALKAYRPVLAEYNDRPLRDFITAVRQGKIDRLTSDLSYFAKTPAETLQGSFA